MGSKTSLTLLAGRSWSRNLMARRPSSPVAAAAAVAAEAARRRWWWRCCVEVVGRRWCGGGGGGGGGSGGQAFDYGDTRHYTGESSVGDAAGEAVAFLPCEIKHPASSSTKVGRNVWGKKWWSVA